MTLVFQALAEHPSHHLTCNACLTSGPVDSAQRTSLEKLFLKILQPFLALLHLIVKGQEKQCLKSIVGVKNMAGTAKRSMGYERGSNSVLANATKRHLRLAAMVTAITMAAVAPSVWAQASNAESYTIRYSTTDLRSEAAIRALHQRIRRVARDSCPDYGVSRELKAGAQCRKQVAADLVARINNPALSALHAGRSELTIAAQ